MVQLLVQKISKSKVFLTIVEDLKTRYFFFLLFCFSCQNISIEENIPMNWTEFDLDMPEGIVVLRGENKKIPLKAWVAKIDMNIPDIQIRVLSSSDKDRKNTPMEFLNETGARIIINGGYFNSDKDPAQHVGLLKTSGMLEEPASHSVFRDSERYFITRGAFGISSDGLPDIAWSSTIMIQFSNGHFLKITDRSVILRKCPFEN